MTDHPFELLSPDLILDAVEANGFPVDGRLLALNSYENRVYQIGIDGSEPLIAKFYRPERWSDEQILEEHEFAFELFDNDIPLVPPIRDADGKSLWQFENFRFALFPRKGGRAAELDDLDNLYSIGQWLGRIHGVGSRQGFSTRPELNIQTFGYDSFAFLAEHYIPQDLRSSYVSLCEDLLSRMAQIIAEVGDCPLIRVHGDCHAGNILWRDEAPLFVDLDDTRMAPAIQDIWMFLCGDRDRQMRQLSELMDGYAQFHSFDPRQLRLVEVFRTLRIMHFSAWLGRRWKDPAFPQYFPWYNSARYWGEHILQLREQFAAIAEPPLQLFP